MRVVVVGADSDTGTVSGDSSDIVTGTTIITPLSSVRATTEEKGNSVVVGRCKREHDGGGGSRIYSSGIRHVGQVRGCLGVVVVEDGLAIRLHEQLTGRQQPNKGVEVDRKSVSKELQVDWVPVTRREKFVGGVILSGSVDITTILVTTDDDQTSVLESLGRRVPTLSSHLKPTAHALALVIRGFALDVLAGFVGTRVDHSDGTSSISIAISSSIGRGDTTCCDSCVKRASDIVRNGENTTHLRWLPPKMTQVPLPRTLPPAQKVFEYTSRVRSKIQAVGNIYTRLNGSLLTFIRLNVILGGPCGMGAICAVNGDRVVFCLVNDIDLLVITQEHLTAVMNILSCIKF